MYVKQQYRSIIDLLEKYSPSDSWEQECKERMLLFVREHKDCFDRSLPVGHFTGSAWLLDHDQTHALLMHHAKLDKWLQLGGHCDGRSDVCAVAIKEAQEESGIQAIVSISSDIFDIDIHAIPAIGPNPEHLHYDVRFLLRVVSDESIAQNSESKELRWISKNRTELPTNERSVVRMFEKWINRPLKSN
jgi:8-oxo-dGTP pyrophosphatase MutT (NUDIX family)